jgi:acetyl-CoA acetyltransferase
VVRSKRKTLRSQQHAKAARDSGRPAKEIMPVPIPATKKTPARTFEHDEFIRDDTTAEALAALPVQPGTSPIQLVLHPRRASVAAITGMRSP